LVPFSGECLVHRAEVLLRRGHWLDSLAEAQSAARCAERDGLAAPAAAAAYQQGEALRRLGRLPEAERAYLAAQRAGHDPMPGLALLRLEQHRRQVALASIERALAVAEDPLRRARLLPAAVEVVLAADQSVQALGYVRELGELALRWPAPGFRAAALQASGAVALSGGDAARAATALAQAWGCWTSQQAPFEAAQTRLLLGRACAALVDREASAAHHTAAEAALAALQGAAAQPTARTGQQAAQPGGLSTREAQVLQLVATGRTNRAIAERLVLSERTVDRHVSNILGKLNVATRT
jgi:ATP/maltotriose-dependent transcriptional regulator MalT